MLGATLDFSQDLSHAMVEVLSSLLHCLFVLAAKFKAVHSPGTGLFAIRKIISEFVSPLLKSRLFGAGATDF